MSTRLSVVMIAKNAADLLPDCLASVAWADEIVILDSGSTDNTVDVARAAGAKVFVDADWQGYGIQRVYTEDGSLDETMAVKNHDVTLVPKGHHPCGVPYGYEMYYLNVMAGPRRNWRFQNDPDHDWIYQRDTAQA